MAFSIYEYGNLVFSSACHVSLVTCHVSHVTCHMSHVTCHMSHVICHLSHVTCILFIYLILSIIVKKLLSLSVEVLLSTGPTLFSFSKGTSLLQQRSGASRSRRWSSRTFFFPGTRQHSWSIQPIKNSWNKFFEIVFPFSHNFVNLYCSYCNNVKTIWR